MRYNHSPIQRSRYRFCDSDWAGPGGAQIATIVMVAGAVAQVTAQTQPGAPATSSPDAERRGVSRATREAIFVKELIELDFGVECQKPRVWTDSSSAMQAAKELVQEVS